MVIAKAPCPGSHSNLVPNENQRLHRSRISQSGSEFADRATRPGVMDDLAWHMTVTRPSKTTWRHIPAPQRLTALQALT